MQDNFTLNPNFKNLPPRQIPGLRPSKKPNSWLSTQIPNNIKIQKRWSFDI